MLGLEIVFLVSAAKREEFLQTADRLRPRDDRPDALLRGFFADQAQPDRFVWIERWGDERAAEERLRSEDLRVLTGAIEVLGELVSLQVLGLDLRRTSLPRASANST